MQYIEKIDNNNANNEYYLTQIFELIKKDNIIIDFCFTNNIQEITGVNTIEQLNKLENLNM